ncbi:MAG TPA: Ldh family oxidoreductase [Opitutaceae bacterium]|jgi:L-lactate dehydrogenase
MHPERRYRADDLKQFAGSLLERAGLERAKAEAVAEILVEGDLLGHTTHGLQLLALYLTEIEGGRMSGHGEPKIVADFPAAVTWDGQRLPGQWLTLQAIDVAVARAKTQGTGTVVIRRSHHIGALAAYLKRVTDQGLVIILSCSDPYTAGVAPHGGRTGVFTPNPFAAGWPTQGDPVMFDVSQSITTNGMIKRLLAEGRKFPGQWVLDHAGNPSDDPAVMTANPPGTLLPAGGTDHGHKGYAMGLFVEMLTGGLAGHGRADPREGWSSTTYVQVMSPALFGGIEEFARQTSAVADACRASVPRPGFARVRLPGESGLRKREEQLTHGVALYPGIIDSFGPWIAKFAINLPRPVS